MTCASNSNAGKTPASTPPDHLLALVRLIAREAACSDFATRFNLNSGEMA